MCLLEVPPLVTLPHTHLGGPCDADGKVLGVVSKLDRLNDGQLQVLGSGGVGFKEQGLGFRV